MNLKAAFLLSYLSNKGPAEIAEVLPEVLAGLPAAHLDLLAEAVVVELRARKALQGPIRTKAQR